MSIKNHPFYDAPIGAVYAVAIATAKWGFVRFFRGSAIAVLRVVGNAPNMSSIDWKTPPIGWFFFVIARRNDATEVIRLGIVPFADEASEWPPPCFVPPDAIDNCYKVHHKGFIQRATEDQTRGMNRCRRVTPSQLADFLRSKMNNGELHHISSESTQSSE